MSNQINAKQHNKETDETQNLLPPNTPIPLHFRGKYCIFYFFL